MNLQELSVVYLSETHILSLSASSRISGLRRPGTCSAPELWPPARGGHIRKKEHISAKQQHFLFSRQVKELCCWKSLGKMKWYVPGCITGA